MNMLDLARALFARTWKPLGITALAVLVLILWISAFGVGTTVGFVLFVGGFALLYYKGNEIYFLLKRHFDLVSDKVKAGTAKLNAWWSPIWKDITGEAKAVASARADLNSAKAARKDAKKELKASRKAVKKLAKDAAKALQTQLIAAGNGESVNDLAVETLNARKDADLAVTKARSAKELFGKAILAEFLAEHAYHNAVQEYRNRKSNEATVS